MPPEERDPALLWDLAEHAKSIVRAMRGVTFSEYLEDGDLRMIVERRLEYLGEIVKRISTGCITAHPEIPWGSMVGQRNVLAHDYDQIDHQKVWEAATMSVPALIESLQALLAKYPLEGEP